MQIPLMSTSLPMDRVADDDSGSPALPPVSKAGSGESELKEAFHQFVGETFYGQLIKAMRQSTGKPAYLHGGRGEEIFQAQFDQVLTEKMTEATDDSIAGPMFELFRLPMNR